MAIYLTTIYVEDIAGVILLFDSVRIYRSTSGSDIDRVLYDSFSLVAGQVAYEWIDNNGASSYVIWSTYFNSGTLAESSYSAPILYGEDTDRYVPGFNFISTTYPVEYSLTSDDIYAVDKIRFFVGDQKTVKRDYVSSNCSDGYVNVSDDGYSYQLTERGWPLKVIKDGIEHISRTNPIVNDYSFLTFSGIQISTVSGILDVWYEGFRHSDRELFKIYNSASAPPRVTLVDFTDEMRIIVSSVGILKSEVSRLMGESTGSFNLQGELSYNPEPLIRQKREHIKDLEQQLAEMVSDTNQFLLTGVRLD